MAKLKIYLRHYQHKDKDGNNIVYVGANPNVLTVQPGDVSDNQYVDFSADFEDSDKLSFAWKLRDTPGKADGASNIERGSSGRITAVNDAYRFIMAWLNDSVSAPLNLVQVKVEDPECGFFDEWVIKSDGIEVCDDDVCSLEISLRQQDPTFDCIQKTLITDNWQNWFDNTGAKRHPRFAYCNEFRPAFLLTAIFMQIALFGFIVQVLWVILFPAIIVLAIVVNIIIGIIRTFQKLFGGDPIDYIDLGEIPTPGEVKEFISDIGVQVAGCGRELPAPLVRDYISNVCSKCNVRVDQYTAPIFFEPLSKYYNLTMTSAEVKRGVREDNGVDFWQDDNDPILTLDMLLDKLQGVFNAEWRLRNNTLYFNRKDKFLQEGFLYDFMGADKPKIIEGVCFTWNEVKKPAYFRAGYTSDASDMVANDAKRRYNDLVECNNPPNPLLEGEGNKVTTDFAPTRFRGDGIYKDYIEQAFAPLQVIQFIAPIIIPVKNQLKNRLGRYKNVVLTEKETFLTNKLIIWDGQGDKRAARAIAPFEYNGVLPNPNPRYNTAGEPYHFFHQADETYDDFNNQNMKLINYPMFFEAMFEGNLWDQFHEIDDPRVNPPANKTFELKIPLCCEDVTRLGLDNGAIDIALARHVLVNGGEFYRDGKITEIEVSYDASDSLGRWISIKGKV